MTAARVVTLTSKHRELREKPQNDGEFPPTPKKKIT